MVYDVMNLVGCELMQDRNSYCSICECGKEGYCPVAHIASAEGNLVTPLNAAFFKQDV